MTFHLAPYPLWNCDSFLPWQQSDYYDCDDENGHVCITLTLNDDRFGRYSQ